MRGIPGRVSVERVVGHSLGEEVRGRQGTITLSLLAELYGSPFNKPTRVGGENEGERGGGEGEGWGSRLWG